MVFLTWLDSMITPQTAALTMARLVDLAFVAYFFTLPIYTKTMRFYNSFVSDQSLKWAPEKQQKKESKSLNFVDW